MQKNIRNPNWWRRHITLQKCCVIIFGLLANQMAEELKSSALAGQWRMQDITKTNPESSQSKMLRLDFQQKDVCNSKECERTAEEILSRMNQTVEPCDDFYQFACGNYIKTAKLRDDERNIDEFRKLGSQVREELRDLIAEERPTTDPNYLKQPNILYKACMNEKLIDDMGTKYIEKISESLGGWPVIVGDSWDKDNTWSWQETIKRLRNLGFDTNILMKLSIGQDFKNPTKRIINLNTPSISVSNIDFYYKYMCDFARLMGAEKEAAERELYQAVQLAIYLQNNSHQPSRNLNDFYNPLTIKELQKSYPYVQWLDYINALLPEGRIIDDNEMINLVNPSYFYELGEVLRNTSKRVLANYVMWHMHEGVAFSLPQKFREASFKYKNASETSKPAYKQRSEQCVDFISDRLGFATGSLYIRKYFQPDSKAAVTEIAENVRNAFKKTLDGVDWMDQITKKEAKKKIHGIQAVMGYPEELLDNAKLEEYYRKLQIYPDRLTQSIQNVNIFFANKLVGTDANWMPNLTPQKVNGLYDLWKNRLEIPAAMLQGYFFNAKRPKYMNYGAIGSIIGHEITAAVDDVGRQLDAEGKIINWWQHETEKSFLEKAQCIIKQYSDFKEKQTGLSLNGIRTQGKNIADNGGFKHSYLAYNQWLNEHGEERPLPGLTKYTSRQMFWISAAQMTCSKYSKNLMEYMMKVGIHPPAEFRISGAFRNMESFSSDFKCPLNSPMNPTHKCAVW